MSRLPTMQNMCPICAPAKTFKTHSMLRYHLLDDHNKVWKENSSNTQNGVKK